MLLIYEYFYQRLFPTTVTQQAAQVQVFRNPLGAQQDTGSCFVEAFKGHADAVQALWYEFESHLAVESSTGLLWKIYI